MIRHYEFSSGLLKRCVRNSGTVRLHAGPGAAERVGLIAELRIDDHTIDSALDPDEVSRIEHHQDHLFIIFKRPKNFAGGAGLQFDVASLGFLLYPDRLEVIVADDYQLENADLHCRKKLETVEDALLFVLYVTVHHFLEHLKVIKLAAREIQEQINRTMENRHLIQMFGLSESLIFYINAISMNGVVLERLRHHCVRQDTEADVLAFLDDLIIENNQCYKQAEIYSSVFSGLMDARGTIINNNMNILLRNLTIVNVVFMPLNLIASIGGMSEFSMMTQGIPWPLSYGIFTLALVAIGAATISLIRKMAQAKPATTSAFRRLPGG